MAGVLAPGSEVSPWWSRTDPGVKAGSSRDSWTRMSDTHNTVGGALRTSAAADCPLLPLCESEWRFVDEDDFVTIINSLERSWRGRWGRDNDDRGEGGGCGRDGDFVGEKNR